MADLEKIVELLSELTIPEAVELKEKLEETWGVKASAGGGAIDPAMLAAMAAGGGAAEEAEEKTEFDLVLKEVGPKKINVIKAVRSFTSLGLREAKELVDGAPSTILEAVAKEAADDAKAKLEAEGAVVEIK